MTVTVPLVVIVGALVWVAWRFMGRQTIADVLSRLPAIESGLGTFRGAVRAYPTPDGKANRFELRVLDKDPHADAISWPGPSVSSITEPIDLGPFEDAIPAKVLFLRRHGLFGGTTGSGNLPRRPRVRRRPQLHDRFPAPTARGPPNAG